jgi:phosphatidylglycerol:prolipoprotein diacylglycerol transferase
MGYGIARFTVEFFREPDAQLQDFARATHLSMGQWLTLPLILTGLVLLFRAFATPEASPANRPEPA